MIVGGSTARPVKIEDLLESRLSARLDRLDFRSRKIFAGKMQGERRSKKRGQSVEFDDYREYVSGDDLRHIDWNVFARFDRLFIKLFLEEEDLALHVALDASASMDAGEPSKLVFASRLAMALAYVGLCGNNRVGLSVFGVPGMFAPDADAEGEGRSKVSISRLADLRGKHHVPRVARFLMDSVWPESRRSGPAGGAGLTTFSDALTTIARQRVGKGVMVVISDFLIDPKAGGYEVGLRSLAAAGGYDTWAMQVLSPSELEPEREVQAGVTGDLRLTDIETGRAAEVTITAPLIRKYKERLERYCNDLHSYCAARQITHVLTRSDASIETLILETLRRQGMVG
ncbi:MAG: DUF58 domain-containing protein [Phycisphaerae bacterium]|nr:DUF58 domain-containing protein [Phycisphaerae bacterium]